MTGLAKGTSFLGSIGDAPARGVENGVRSYANELVRQESWSPRPPGASWATVNGQPVQPTGRGTLYTGKSLDKITDPGMIGKEGFKTSGTNFDLTKHTAGDGESALQGATQEILTQNKEGGAARFAADSPGSSGWIFKIVGVEFWDTAALLYSKWERSPFLGSDWNVAPYGAEAELTIRGNIPGSMIEGWAPATNVEGTIVIGEWVKNPNYIPR